MKSMEKGGEIPPFLLSVAYNDRRNTQESNMASERKTWYIGSKYEFDNEILNERSCPGEHDAEYIALSYARQLDIDCGDYPLLHEDESLEVYVLDEDAYEVYQEDKVKAKQQAWIFKIRGELIPHYYVEEFK